MEWEPLGCILQPDPSVPWMVTHTGASAALVNDDGLVDVYVTGRDGQNRSVIGRGRLDLGDLAAGIRVEHEPVFEHGDLGAFDENGVAYPGLVDNEGELWMYYVGWMPSVLTPFQNHVGLARQDGERFVRVSRAPILPRTDDDYLAMGSCEVRKEGGRWRMWYTAWTSWGDPLVQPKHTYVIKYAESEDGVNWIRDNTVCIGASRPEEHSISRPTIHHDGTTYHMWFCWKGDYYDLGYATSVDGVSWTRQADPTFDRADFDSHERCYPSVFSAGGHLYMLYAGNDYGAGGLGLARAVR